MKNLIFTICCATSLFLNANNIFMSQNEYYKSDIYKNAPLDNKLRVDDQVNLSFEYVYRYDEILFKTNNKDIYESICTEREYYNITKINDEYVIMQLEGCYEDGYVVFKTDNHVLNEFRNKKKVYILFDSNAVTYFVTDGFNEYEANYKK